MSDDPRQGKAGPEQKQDVSLFLRVPARGVDLNDIAAKHVQVLKRSGKVWLGVMGRTLSGPVLDQLRRNGQFLFIVQKWGATPVVFKGAMSDVAATLTLADRHLIPEYYDSRGLLPNVKFWVKLTTLKNAHASELDHLQVARTGTKVNDLLRSMASIAVVTRCA